MIRSLKSFRAEKRTPSRSGRCAAPWTSWDTLAAERGHNAAKHRVRWWPSWPPEQGCRSTAWPPTPTAAEPHCWPGWSSRVWPGCCREAWTPIGRRPGKRRWRRRRPAGRRPAPGKTSLWRPWSEAGRRRGWARRSPDTAPASDLPTSVSCHTGAGPVPGEAVLVGLVSSASQQTSGNVVMWWKRSNAEFSGWRKWNHEVVVVRNHQGRNWRRMAIRSGTTAAMLEDNESRGKPTGNTVSMSGQPWRPKSTSYGYGAVLGIYLEKHKLREKSHISRLKS